MMQIIHQILFTQLIHRFYWLLPQFPLSLLLQLQWKSLLTGYQTKGNIIINVVLMIWPGVYKARFIVSECIWIYIHVLLMYILNFKSAIVCTILLIMLFFMHPHSQKCKNWWRGGCWCGKYWCCGCIGLHS